MNFKRSSVRFITEISELYGQRIEPKNFPEQNGGHIKDKQSIRASSSTMLEAGRQWINIFKMLRENYFQARIPYPVKLSIK